MIITVGKVNGRRIAILKNGALTDLRGIDVGSHKEALYKQAAKKLDQDVIVVFDAGFKLVEATTAKIPHRLIRLAKHCTFGKTVGQILDFG